MEKGQLYGYWLRQEQVEILAYNGGYLAVSAVPGSGKTLTLALLAAKLIIEGHIDDEAEVLVVTLQNTAVDNISQRIRDILTSQGLPAVGYRVSTLHKLGADILRERRDLAGVEEHVPIVDENVARRTMRNAAEAWIAGERDWWLSFLRSGSETERRRLEEAWRSHTEEIGREVTRLCKHLRLTPDDAQALIAEEAEGDDFLRIGVELYQRYQHLLHVRSGLDFDDLIWRAIEALEQDPTFVLGLRSRWPYILEDEAQDSSPLQEEVLSRLAGVSGNWVRVGDPNQSINATFTAADPRYFRRFIARHPRPLTLSESGRCGEPIMALANRLVRWACEEHPEPQVRASAFLLQDIRPTAAGDVQPNPPADECGVFLRREPFPDVAAQAYKVADWAAGLVRRHPEQTVAILCPTNWQGNEVVQALQEMSSPVPFQDLLKSTPAMRNVARVLAAACHYLGGPTSRDRLASLHGALVRYGVMPGEQTAAELRHRGALLRSVEPQELLFPRGSADIREALPPGVAASAEDVASLSRFRELAARWVRAWSLPVDQLVLTIAQDLFRDEGDLALCHAIATGLRSAAELNPLWRLPDFAADLDAVARNERTFSGLSLADAGYTAEPGCIVVTTMHKAKGLEWDTVCLMCVDSLEFPDSLEDAFRDEPYFMSGRSPSTEARKRLEQLADPEFDPLDEDPVNAARLEYIAERLRLLYVGITRARRNLCMTWSEMNGRRPVRPASALLELSAFQRLGARGGVA